MSSILSAHTEPSNPFGHGLRDKFCLDDDYINLNCGSFGCLPLAVRDEYVRRFSELEGNPDRFMRGSLRTEKAEICSKLADFLGAEPESCVLVPNVAHGINTVLRNFPWKTGDVLIMGKASPPNFLSSDYSHQIPPPTCCFLRDYRSPPWCLQLLP
ncbi:hypothetical protein GYMLUDRAFT_461434 [Collybiopsis luxurians FD-317 M1]|uniref:Aminotransferase class V domain-containing protein n=1 Tax=Collybiopsis luxurians FD-317 M1 TaxID=944289 RepID=A0A0D0C6U6_9AGAR|nr:hypothetical protein GYMLUDRAFT_461434 [Collybiopsis luxurians FD-317 M1]